MWRLTRMRKKMRMREAVSPRFGGFIKTGYATRGILLALARERCRRYLVNNAYFLFSTLKKQDDLRNPLQDAEIAVSGVAPGAVDDAVESMPTPEENDNW